MLLVVPVGDVVAVDLKAIEALALDQASLKAAASLARPAKWSEVAASTDGQLIWGTCAGSAANPYRVADAAIACLCHGELRLWDEIAAEPLIGSAVGAIPPSTPPAPLLEDLQRQQKRCSSSPRPWSAT